MEAVELARSSGKPIAQVARDLGVSSQSLHTWIKQADVDAGKREGLTTEEREELRRLRRENRTLVQEREILKKAAQYVSLAFGQQARDAGTAMSMGSKGDYFDNWPTPQELRSAVFDYIDRMALGSIAPGGGSETVT